MNTSPGADTLPAEAAPLAEAAPPQLPLDRKRTRALWAAGEATANKCFRQERLAEGTLDEGEVQVTVVDEDGCLLIDGVFIDLRQGAGVFYGTLIHNLGEQQDVDFRAAYKLTYKDSDGRRRKLTSCADFETFKQIALAEAVRAAAVARLSARAAASGGAGSAAVRQLIATWLRRET